MRREERVTVQGPVKEQQPDGMSHGGGGGMSKSTFLGGGLRPILKPFRTDFTNGLCHEMPFSRFFPRLPTLPSHHITSHHITSHHITSHHITSHHITSHHITSHHITSHHITSHHITSHHITSHHITLHRITLHHTASRHRTIRKQRNKTTFFEVSSSGDRLFRGTKRTGEAGQSKGRGSHGHRTTPLRQVRVRSGKMSGYAAHVRNIVSGAVPNAHLLPNSGSGALLSSASWSQVALLSRHVETRQVHGATGFALCCPPNSEPVFVGYGLPPLMWSIWWSGPLRPCVATSHGIRDGGCPPDFTVWE